MCPPPTQSPSNESHCFGTSERDQILIDCEFLFAPRWATFFSCKCAAAAPNVNSAKLHLCRDTLGAPATEVGTAANLSHHAIIVVVMQSTGPPPNPYASYSGLAIQLKDYHKPKIVPVQL